MQTRHYAELQELISALTGQDFTPQEALMINTLANRRARRAYKSSDYWPRFLVVGEERTVTNSVIDFDEGGLQSIDTFFRIYKDQPYQTNSVSEFEFTVGSGGATITEGGLGSTSAWVTYKAELDLTYGEQTGREDDVPLEWFEYMAQGVFADYLRREGQFEQGMAAEQQADSILHDELMKLDRQGRGIVARRVNTHLSNASRS